MSHIAKIPVVDNLNSSDVFFTNNVSKDMSSHSRHQNNNHNPLHFNPKTRLFRSKLNQKLDPMTIAPKRKPGSQDIRQVQLGELTKGQQFQYQQQSNEMIVTIPPWNQSEEKSKEFQKKMSLVNLFSSIKLGFEQHWYQEKEILKKRHIREVIKALSILTELNSEYIDYIKIIFHAIYKSIYLNQTFLTDYPNFLETIENEKLRSNLNPDKINKFPFCQFSQLLLSEYMKKYESLTTQIEQQETQLEKLQEEMNERNKYVKKLENELSLLKEDNAEARKKQMQNVEEMYLKKNYILQDENNELKELLQTSGEQVEKWQQMNQDLKQENMNLSNEIDDLKFNNHKLQEENKDVKKNQVQLKKRAEYFENQAMEFKDKLDSLILKIQQLSVSVKRLENDKQNLENENKKLGVRAAIGFENLTPRGNYVDILRTNQINLFEIQTTEAQLNDMKTSKFINFITKKLSEISETNRKLQLQNQNLLVQQENIGVIYNNTSNAQNENIKPEIQSPLLQRTKASAKDKNKGKKK